MDFLHLNNDQIRDMPQDEFEIATKYCWLRFTLSRPDFAIRKMFSKKKTNVDPNEPPVEFNVDPDWDLDLDWQRELLAAECSVIPSYEDSNTKKVKDDKDGRI
jgi:hypothetical protein